MKNYKLPPKDNGENDDRKDDSAATSTVKRATVVREQVVSTVKMHLEAAATQLVVVRNRARNQPYDQIRRKKKISKWIILILVALATSITCASGQKSFNDLFNFFSSFSLTK